MSHSVRFLGFAVAAWAGVRAVSLGVIPGAEALAFDRPADAAAAQPPAVPPPVPTDLAPPDLGASSPIAAQPADMSGQPLYPAYPPYAVYPQRYPVYAAYPVAYPAYATPAAWPAPRTLRLPPPRQSPAAAYEIAAAEESPVYYSDPVPQLEEWPLSRIASSSRARRADAASSVPIAPGRLDRLQMTAWAMLRSRPGPTSLASGGTLGGSQAGARLLWRFNPRLAASLRSSAPIGVGQRGGEVAAGVRYQPFANIPVALTAERRQSFGPMHGPGAFALFAEGGVYDRPVAAGFLLDSYLQAGVVGLRDRMRFIDGSATLTRPIWRNLSGGFGVWGGKQPGVARFDAGPRLSLRVGRSMRLHLDYRQKLVGNAQPGSGPVLTIAGDF